MRYSNFGNYLRGAGWVIVASGIALAAGRPIADAAPNEHSNKNSNRQSKKSVRTSRAYAQSGALSLDLQRGAVVPFEGTVVAMPNACSSKLSLTVAWDETNGVHVRMTGSKALTPYPDVNRTAGLDFFTPLNPTEPEDIVDGGYRLSIFGAAGDVETFYYDPNTFALLGGGSGFVPPDGALTLEIPTMFVITSPLFQPNSKGNVNFDWSFSYATPGLGDYPNFSYFTFAFVPPDLCHVDPYHVDRTSLRPWFSSAKPLADAHPWNDYLAGGMLFSVTVEPNNVGLVPTPPTSIGTYSNASVVAAGIPRDWTLNFDAALAGVAPPIVYSDDAGICQQYFAGQHLGVNGCQAQ